MKDIDKARRLFRDAGLSFPKIPGELAGEIKEIEPWLFSTRLIATWPYNLQWYVAEAEGRQVLNYAILAHTGHGVNSYAVQYYLVRSTLRMFLHLGWGGVYMDAKKESAKIRECFSIANRVVRAAEEVTSFQDGDHLTIVGSDFYGSYWRTPGDGRPRGENCSNSLGETPQGVLTEALGWLTGLRGGKRMQKTTSTPLPGIQYFLLPVLNTLANGLGHSVEEIRNRVKEELKLTDVQTKRTHPKSGQKILVNRVAWALSHLVMGKAVKLERTGFYRVTNRGVEILKANPSELTIKDLH